MLVKTLVNRCYKFKSFVYQRSHLVEASHGEVHILVELEARANGPKLCAAFLISSVKPEVGRWKPSAATCGSRI